MGGGQRQIALKWSKGSRQALHAHSDLQAVDPNRLSSRVSGEPHCGQRTLSVQRHRAGPRGCGGAMPYVEQLAPAGRRSSSRWSTPAPARTRRGRRRSPRRRGPPRTSSRIASIAGQPEYVGVIVHPVTPSSASSSTVAQDAEVLDGEHRHLGVEHRGGDVPRPVRVAALTTSPPGARGPGPAARRAAAPVARCARRAAPPPGAAGVVGHGQGGLARARSATRSSKAGAQRRRVDRHAVRDQRAGRRTRRRRAPRRRATRRPAPACMRACDSSVPSPSRSTHWSAWSRW